VSNLDPCCCSCPSCSADATACLNSPRNQNSYLYLPWLLCKTAYKGVTIWPSCGSIVVVLDDDCLLASVLAGKKDDHLLRLQTEKCVYQLLVRPPQKCYYSVWPRPTFRNFTIFALARGEATC